MKSTFRTIAAVVALAAAGVVAADDWRPSVPRAVFSQSNAVAGNAVLMFARDADGSLSAPVSVPTGGVGTGGGLGNQSSVLLHGNGGRLYVTNAGSDDVSVFSTRFGKPRLIQRVASGGARPISITRHDELVYVLNAGDAARGIAANITGFYVGDDRQMRPIPGSTRPLSAANPNPAQIEFDRSGDTLVVTERATNKITLFDVSNGVAGNPVVRDSAGQTPFGFGIDRRNNLIVSEAFGGAPNGSAVSSYRLEEAAWPLEVVSASVPTLQTAACWIVITRDNRFVYTSNTASGTISGYSLSRGGRLSLLNADGITGNTGAGSGPIDLALTRDSRFLYSLNGAGGTVSGFRVRANGQLVPVGTPIAVPAGTNGLAAF
jgi:6-phosphogluconolactonase